MSDNRENNFNKKQKCANGQKNNREYGIPVVNVIVFAQTSNEGDDDHKIRGKSIARIPVPEEKVQNNKDHNLYGNDRQCDRAAILNRNING